VALGEVEAFVENHLSSVVVKVEDDGAVEQTGNARRIRSKGARDGH
jgi:hypothetical protein